MKNQINNIEYIKLSSAEKFWHYSIITLIGIIPILTTIDALKYNYGNYSGVLTINEILLGYLFLIPMIIFYFLQKKRLRYQKINIAINEDKFWNTIRKTEKELRWSTDIKENGYYRGHRKWDGGGSWGEMITIVRKNDCILINSICNPNTFFPSVASYGWNKKNVSTFEKNLNQIIEIDNVE